MNYSPAESERLNKMSNNPKNDPSSDFFSELDTEHAQILKDSAIKPDVAAWRGYRTVIVKAELKRLGFSDRQCRVPCLLIPVWGMSGKIVNYQIRSNSPFIHKRPGKGDKTIKYETVSDRGLCLDIPNDPKVRESLRADGPPLFITEGARKVDSGISQGILTVGLLGVYGWRGRNEMGGLTALPEWENIHLKKRDLYLAFDSDARESKNVRAALKRLKRFLESKKANVKVIWLPPAADGSKVGLDDFFGAGHSVHDLLKHASDEIPDDDASNMNHPYKVSESGLEWVKETSQGIEIIPLTNFTARIIAEGVEDDGTANTQRVFTLEAEMKGKIRRFEVSASRFGAMQWPLEHIGVGAVVWPGRVDHARCAIQLLSEDVEQMTVYKHTGWREVEGAYFYLNAGGAIGGDGFVPHINVKLEGELSRISLPDPPSGERLCEAIRASMGILQVSARSITFPLFASVYRAVLGNCDYGLHLTGESGAGKSEIAALCQMHFGETMDARHLPGSWSSTGNALEALAFSAKDALIVIDDYVPTGRAADIQRQQRDADRIFRGQGNQAGRQRLSSDGSMRSTRWVRGLVLSTGEDTPPGQSLRSRVLILEVDKERGSNSINWNQLTLAQASAAKGLFAEAMAGFIRWLAPPYGEIQKRLKQEIIDIRQQAILTGTHRRLPEIIANLTLGLRWFLRFAISSKVMTQSEAEAMLKDGWDAFGEVAAAQHQHQTSSDPASSFRKLLTAALASGAAHVAMANGDQPKSLYDIDSPVVGADGRPFAPNSWGWREAGGLSNPQGVRIGWISEDGQKLYIQPEAAFAVAQQLAIKSGEQLSISPTTLWKRLRERGYLLSTDKKRRTLTVRRTLQGTSQGVLHIAFDFLGAGSEDQNADNADNAELNISAMARYVADFDVGISSKADYAADNLQGRDGSAVSTTDSNVRNADIEKDSNDGTLQPDVGNVGFSEQAESSYALSFHSSRLEASPLLSDESRIVDGR